MPARAFQPPPPLPPDAVVEGCRALLAGAAREDHLDLLPWLTGHGWAEGDAVRDPAVRRAADRAWVAVAGRLDLRGPIDRGPISRPP